MNLYVITLTNEYPGYDVYLGFVVAAESHAQARALAQAQATRGAGRYRQEGLFLNPVESVCQQIGITSSSRAKARIVLDSFNAG